MIYELLLGLGIMAVIEGLVLALAPLRLEQALEILRQIGQERTRTMGLAIATGGVLLVWLVHG